MDNVSSESSAPRKNADTVRALGECFFQRMLDDLEYGEAAHDYAMRTVGQKTRSLTDEDETAPWYDQYWCCYSEFGTAVMVDMLKRGMNQNLKE